MLHCDLLLAAGPIAFECLHLRCIGPRQLVKRALGAVLLLYGLDAVEASRKRHSGHMNNSHLSRKHGLKLVSRIDIFDD